MKTNSCYRTAFTAAVLGAASLFVIFPAALARATDDYIRHGSALASKERFFSTKGLFFTQERVGKDGKTFKIYKVKTIATPPKNNPGLSDKKRIGAVGEFLRRTKIDELPQFFNILKGDMNFVGPRPVALHDPKAEDEYRHTILGGLFSFATIKGRRNNGKECYDSDKALVKFLENSKTSRERRRAAQKITIKNLEGYADIIRSTNLRDDTQDPSPTPPSPGKA